jgi:hypothetical protein
MAASTILSLMTALSLIGQEPVDESNASSTIVVRRKEREAKEAPPPEPALRPPSITPPVRPAAVAAPSIPRVSSPPPPKASLAPAQILETDVESPKVLPWVTLGLSAVSIGVGAFFAVRTANALNTDELELELNRKGDKIVVPEEFKDHEKAVFANGITATVLISAGVSGAIASTISLAD